jgi:hypothetical protein
MPQGISEFVKEERATAFEYLRVQSRGMPALRSVVALITVPKEFDANDPSRRRWFRQFMNTADTKSVIEFVHERGQRRPADWRKDPAELPQLHDLGATPTALSGRESTKDEIAPTPTQSRGRATHDSMPHRDNYYSLHIFAAQVRGDDVYLHLPPEEVLDAALATDLHCIRVCPSHASEPAAIAALA